MEPFRGNEAGLGMHPHNALLQALVDFGWLGMALVLLLLVLLILRLERRPREERIAGQALFVSAFTVACVSYGLWQSQWLATLLSAALVVLLCRGSDAPEATADPPRRQTR